MNDPYEDILHLPHYISPKRKKMSIEDRAAQFTPFAALSGFEDILTEARQKVDAHNMDEQIAP